MNIKQINAQILLNRTELFTLYTVQTQYKKAKTRADVIGNVLAEYGCHNKLKEIKKKIATLVDIQKALKADLKKELSYQRAAQRMALIKMGSVL